MWKAICCKAIWNFQDSPCLWTSMSQKWSALARRQRSQVWGNAEGFSFSEQVLVFQAGWVEGLGTESLGVNPTVFVLSMLNHDLYISEINPLKILLYHKKDQWIPNELPGDHLVLGCLANVLSVQFSPAQERIISHTSLWEQGSGWINGRAYSHWAIWNQPWQPQWGWLLRLKEASGFQLFSP